MNEKDFINKIIEIARAGYGGTGFLRGLTLPAKRRFRKKGDDRKVTRAQRVKKRKAQRVARRHNRR